MCYGAEMAWVGELAVGVRMVASVLVSENWVGLGWMLAVVKSSVCIVYVYVYVNVFVP